jgi:hypothetical protein
MLGTQQYDTDAPEGAKQSSAYMSRKDIKWIVAILIVLFVVGWPVWYAFMEQRDKQVCATNMRGIYEAMMLYAEQNDSRLPPLYHVGENGAPYLSDGKPFVWASLLLPYMNQRAKFYCPASEESERMPTIGYDERTDERADFDLTYGMYLPMGTIPHLLATNASDTALLLETTNNGALGTYNPVPFRDANGDVVPFDAFMVGFNDSNEMLTPDSKWVTRLAFRDAAKGYESGKAIPRHGLGIHVIFLDGHKGFFKAPNAKVRNIFPDADGPWRTR